jgi:hypothetical protein
MAVHSLLLLCIVNADEWTPAHAECGACGMSTYSSAQACTIRECAPRRRGQRANRPARPACVGAGRPCFSFHVTPSPPSPPRLRFVALLLHWAHPSASVLARATACRRSRRVRPVHQARSAPAGPDDLAGMRGKATFQHVANTAISQLGPCSELSPGANL